MFQSPRNRVNTSNARSETNLGKAVIESFNPLEIGSTLQIAGAFYKEGHDGPRFQSPRNRVNTSNRDAMLRVEKENKIGFNPLEIGSTLQI